MTYEIIASLVAEDLYKVTVVVREGDGVILEGETHVAVATEAEAAAYAEQVFLPDLRRNFAKRIGELVLPCDMPDEPLEGDPV